MLLFVVEQVLLPMREVCSMPNIDIQHTGQREEFLCLNCPCLVIKQEFYLTRLLWILYVCVCVCVCVCVWQVKALLRDLVLKPCFHLSTLRLLGVYVYVGGLLKINVVTVSWPHEDRLIKETEQEESEIRREGTVASNVGERESKIRTVVCQAPSRKQIALSYWVIWGELNKETVCQGVGKGQGSSVRRCLPAGLLREWCCSCSSAYRGRRRVQLLKPGVGELCWEAAWRSSDMWSRGFAGRGWRAGTLAPTFSLFYKLLNFILEYSRLTMLWWFQVHSKGTHPCLYVYPFLHLSSHPGCHITLSRVLCAVQ